MLDFACWTGESPGFGFSAGGSLFSNPGRKNCNGLTAPAIAMPPQPVAVNATSARQAAASQIENQFDLTQPL
jgi:hypothetical protein